MGRILVADDHDSLRRALARALIEAGHEITEASNGNVAIERLHETNFDVVLSDLKMGGSDGLDVLRTAKALQPQTAVILMTAFGSVHTAVEAMKIGAFDYVPKPFEIEEMEVKIDKALEHRRLRNEVDYLRHEQGGIYQFDNIIGASGALQRVLDVVKKVAKSNTTVLINGETGTGKELIAGAIHHNSLRAARNFVKVNCAALQENLLESELFGHERGAFTGADKQRIGRFEQADGGTLFLDEIGDMSANTQAKILRVLQEHEFERLGGTRTIRVDVRLIAATNRNLAAMVETGGFREDLYYRLNVVQIEMPPVRDRKEDIPALTNFFIKRFAVELKKRIEGVTPEALKLLMRYNWPGNIRELENTIERAALLSDERLISADDLRIGGTGTTADHDAPQTVVKIPPQGVPLEEIERQAVIEALKMANWVQKDAAELLSISPRVMNYKIKTLGIDFPRSRRPPVGAPHGDVAGGWAQDARLGQPGATVRSQCTRSSRPASSIGSAARRVRDGRRSSARRERHQVHERPLHDERAAHERAVGEAHVRAEPDRLEHLRAVQADAPDELRRRETLRRTVDRPVERVVERVEPVAADQHRHLPRPRLGVIEHLHAGDAAAREEHGADLRRDRRQVCHESFEIGVPALEHRGCGPRLRRRVHARALARNLVPHRALVRTPGCIGSHREVDLGHLVASASRVERAVGGRELAAAVRPAPRLDAGHRDVQLAVCRHQQRDVDDAVLTRADEFLAVDEQDRARPVVDDEQFGHAPAFGNLGDTRDARADGVLQRVVERRRRGALAGEQGDNGEMSRVGGRSVHKALQVLLDDVHSVSWCAVAQ